MANEEILRGLSLAMTIQNNAIRNIGGSPSDDLSDFRNWLYLRNTDPNYVVGTCDIIYDASKKESTLNLFTGSFHERFCNIQTVKANTNYIFRFKLASPTGFTYGGYGWDRQPFNHELAFVTTALPGISQFLSSYYDPLSMTSYFDDVAAGTGEKYSYSCQFNSGRTGDITQVALVFDCGQILDETSVVLKISDVELVEV